jgi:hypothetical protein
MNAARYTRDASADQVNAKGPAMVQIYFADVKTPFHESV